ncbi:uncharacterized protein EI90DRAFT_74889 [Cantharellus anzutake]|uniref:uncharacterized protein n=1 Tax=Cantharellus anzutake TaxID=1750568 RepID=UPI0019064709|nr:uncharacterized protein EI90DRAFT_74889 [Cantharellus anzutake]KAF8336825.1 hypothetical protein EI90DRAFT_74889 [Cantharellus anzutake]
MHSFHSTHTHPISNSHSFHSTCTHSIQLALIPFNSHSFHSTRTHSIQLALIPFNSHSFHSTCAHSIQLALIPFNSHSFHPTRTLYCLSFHLTGSPYILINSLSSSFSAFRPQISLRRIQLPPPSPSLPPSHFQTSHMSWCAELFKTHQPFPPFFWLAVSCSADLLVFPCCTDSAISFRQ